MTDGEILLRARTDADAFRHLFDRHFNAVWNYLRRRVGRDVADELASEVFLTAFRARHRYQPSGDSALPWLYGIAANLSARNYRRETRKLRAYARTGVQPSEELDVESVLGRIVAHDRGREVAAALAELRREDRETLFLSAIVGLTHSEIAEALGVAEGTVGSRLHRARSRLVAALATGKGMSVR
jgi:RNA polymerase sigma-70 factor (ECF subfamily)